MAWGPILHTLLLTLRLRSHEGAHELSVAREVLECAKLCTDELFGDATPTRTAEVTICTTLRRTARSPSTVTELFEASQMDGSHRDHDTGRQQFLHQSMQSVGGSHRQKCSKATCTRLCVEVSMPVRTDSTGRSTHDTAQNW